MKRILLLLPLILLVPLVLFLYRQIPNDKAPNNISKEAFAPQDQNSPKSPLGSGQILPPAQPLKIQQIAPVKYAIRSLKQDVMEIGTERHSPPKPYLKLNKWEGEVNLKVSIPFNTSETPEEIDGKLRYKGEGVKVDFYPKAPQEITEKDSKGNEQKYTINEEGGVEFDTILEEKPVSNRIIFPIETQNLDFFYQPPLDEENTDPNLTCIPTECKDKDGNIVNFRPENVVGSYAVYHESKQGDYSKMGGKNYMAGKAFHIYRPKVNDSAGNEIWGELNIDEQAGTLTITVDQAWLDNAVYPVIIDPTFGYTTKGATQFADTGDVIRGYIASSTEAGTVTSISVYIKYYNGGATKSALYKDSDKSLQGYTEEWTTTSGWDNWKAFNIISGGSLSAIDYHIVYWKNSTWDYFYYDSATGKYRAQAVNYGTWPDPWNPITSNLAFSIYATYTASATPTPTPTPLPQMDFNGLNMQGVNIN